MEFSKIIMLWPKKTTPIYFKIALKVILKWIRIVSSLWGFKPYKPTNQQS